MPDLIRHLFAQNKIIGSNYANYTVENNRDLVLYFIADPQMILLLWLCVIHLRLIYNAEFCIQTVMPFWIVYKDECQKIWPMKWLHYLYCHRIVPISDFNISFVCVALHLFNEFLYGIFNFKHVIEVHGILSDLYLPQSHASNSLDQRKNKKLSVYIRNGKTST